MLGEHLAGWFISQKARQAWLSAYEVVVFADPEPLGRLACENAESGRCGLRSQQREQHFVPLLPTLVHRTQQTQVGQEMNSQDIP